MSDESDISKMRNILLKSISHSEKNKNKKLSDILSYIVSNLDALVPVNSSKDELN